MSGLFKYSLLRYHHSDVLNEVVNIGVLFYFEGSDRLYFKYPKSLQRLRGLYSDEFSEQILIQSLKSIDNACKEFNKLSIRQNGYGQFPLIPTDFVVERDRILPVDATVLRFGEVRAAVQYTSETKVISDYSTSYLKYYDTGVNPYHRNDEKHISKSLFSALQQYNANYSRYIKKDIVVAAPILPEGRFPFEFSWQNKVEHYVKPLSFDLSESSGINAKAAQYFGYFSAVMDSIADNGKIDVITHRPEDNMLLDSYRRAIDMISRVSGSISIVTEDEYHDYAKEVIDHNTSSDGEQL